MEDVVKAYVAAWAEQDPEKRAALLETAWAEDGVYEDPTATVAGRTALTAHIGGFHTAMPGARIDMTSGISAHHGNIYFAWRLLAGDGSVVVEGVDFGRLDADGRLASITGFFGPPGA